MAKARHVELPDATGGLRAWVLELFGVRFGEMLSFREAALDPGRTEGIHGMRVAIRRLRSLNGDLKKIGPGLGYGSLTRELKQVADALGAVRDADVGINSLLKFREKAEVPEVVSGIDGFIDRLRCERQDAFLKAQPHLSGDRMDELRLSSDAYVRKITASNKVGTERMDEAADKAIALRIDEFRKLAPALYRPFRVHRLHKLRIAGKHLRYAVEIFTDQTDESWSGRAAEIAKMQDHLGDLHDGDVWIDQLGAILKKRSEGSAADSERLAGAWLLSKFVRKRTVAYRSALSLWTEWERSGFLDSVHSRSADPSSETETP